MAQIILDISANTHKNDWNYLKKMIDEVISIDTRKHDVVFKHQLFTKPSKNTPLDWDIFKKAYNYCEKKEYATTSSIFDRDSLTFLSGFDTPFVKIANDRNLDYLIELIPRGKLIYISYGDVEDIKKMKYKENIKRLICVSNYPSKVSQYEQAFDISHFVKNGCGISDHTTTFDLYNKYNPDTIEFHLKLDDSTGLDAGKFARTPKQLQSIL